MRCNFQIRYIVFMLLLGGMSFMGCKRDNSDQGKIVDIKKEFNLQPWESLRESGSEFSFAVNSIEKKCDGTKMRIIPTLTQGKVVLTLQSFILPDSCLIVSDVIRDTIHIAALNNGDYSLQINLKDVVINSGILNVSDAKYTLQMASQDGINLSQLDILRVPQGAIWGTISYEKDQESLVTAFSDSLKLYAHNFSVQNGDYGYFKFDNNGVAILTPKTSPNFAYQRTFFMRLDKPISNLTNLLSNTKAKLGKNGNLSIMAYNGFTF